MKDRKKIAVLFGGRSPEYKVSLQSAFAVLKSIDQAAYEVVPVGITAEGEWYVYTGPYACIPQDRWNQPEMCTSCAVSPSPRVHGLLIFEKTGTRELPLDGAFPVLHGKNGEDGTVQGVFALAGIPVAGCGLLASALCMDKELAHRVAEQAGIRVPRSARICGPWEADRAELLAREIGYPLFVKPIRAGSSFGISRVSSPETLRKAVADAFAYDTEVELEEAIDGFEVGCAVLGTKQLTIGVVDEIELSGGFFDYEEKYTLKTSQIHVPARIPAEKAEEIRRTAARLYRALGCGGFARVDMFLKSKGEIIFNEVNTIPGCTLHSRYPNMLARVGLEFPDWVRMLLEEAVGEEAGCDAQPQAEADVLQGEKNTKQSAQRPEGDQQENTGTEVTKDRRSGRKAVMTTGQGENKDAVD